MGPVKIYQACKMTGRSARSVIAQSSRARKLFNRYGISVLDPVKEEHVATSWGVLQTNTDNTQAQLRRNWARDKELIQDAHVFVDLTPTMKSEGVAHEMGYARYHLWIPVVRVYPKGKKPPYSIATLEDDVMAEGLDEAAKLIVDRWGTWEKRLVWRLGMYNRCLLKAWWLKLTEWF